jgi:hypothetical protein
MGFVRNKIMKYSKQITKLANQHEKSKIKGWQLNHLWYN